MRPVHVSGAGIIAPSGTGRVAAFDGLLAGVSRTRRVERFEPSAFKSQVAAPVDGLQVRDGVHDRHVELVLRAVDEAVGEAGIDEWGPSDGIVYATAIGATERLERSFRLRTPPGRDAFSFDEPTRMLARRLGIVGPRLTVTTGCTASIDALGTAIDLVVAGTCERVLVATSEAPLAPITFAAFDRIGAISRERESPQRASRPFHVQRDGFVLGEGGAAVVVESEDALERREGRSLAKLLGWASVSSGYHMTGIRTDGTDIARAMRGALHAAGCPADGIDAVDLHATSTRMNDLSESEAVNLVFGQQAHRVPVMAQKSVNGHALGASNLMEIVGVISAGERGLLPPVANLDAKDPGCRVDARDIARPGPWKTFLKVSSGFSGIHTSLVISVN